MLHMRGGSKPHSSSLKWLVPLVLLASSVVSDEGPFTVSPPMPSICTASTITYSSSMVMPTGSFDIDPGTYGMGSSGQKWNFSVNAGIVLSEWGENGLSLTKWIVPNGGAAPPYSTSNSTSQNASVSYTFTVPTDGSWDGGMMTGLATSSGTFAEFTLIITALLKCDKPVVSECGVNSDPAFTTSQWQAWNTDAFLQAYYTNYTKGAFGPTGDFMNTFYNDFTDGEGSAYDQCNVTDGPINNCNWIGACSNLATGSMSALTPYKEPAYLTMYASRNVMALFNNIYVALQWASADMDRIYTGLGAVFVDMPSGITTTWDKILPILNALLTLIAVIFIAFEAAIFTAMAIFSAAIFGGAGDIGELTASDLQTDFQLEEIWTDSTLGQEMVNSLSDSIYNMSDTVWQGGANITKYLKGGNFLTAKTSLAETNAAGADRDGPSLQATEFFENQFVSALINSYFKSNNAYIVYIPYGRVQQLDCTNSWGDFTQETCEKDWVGKGRHDFSQSWNETVVASCMPDGMAVLYNAFSGAQANSQPQSFYIRDFSVNDITYDPVYMIESSVNGFLANGFNFNATDAWASQIAIPTSDGLLDEDTSNAIMNVQQWTPGMYNLDVCVLYNLASVPNSNFQSQYGNAYPAQTQPCQCMSDLANITIGGFTSYFRDNIATQAGNFLSAAGGSDNWCPMEDSEGKACDKSQGPGY